MHGAIKAEDLKPAASIWPGLQKSHSVVAAGLSLIVLLLAAVMCDGRQQPSPAAKRYGAHTGVWGDGLRAGLCDLRELFQP